MSDNNTPGDGGDVIDFARRTGRTGFNLTPTLTLDPPVIPPPSQPSPAPDTTPSRGRRSPLDILNALPEPGLTQPVITPNTPAPAPAPGQVPDTFRSEPGLDDSIGPRLGALSLAAILAVAVAALRGAHTVASSWWERRQARYAETAQLREARLKHQLAMQNIGDKATQQRAKTNSKVPSSSEFGRKTLGGRGGKGGASSDSGSGGGQSKKSSPTGSGGTGPKRKNTPKGPGTGSGGSGTGGLGGGKRRKDRGSSGGLFPKRDTKSPKQPRNRTDKNTNSGRGGADKPVKTKNRSGLGPLSLLKKHRNKNNGTPLQKKQPNSPKPQQGPKVNLRKNPRTPNPNAKQQTPASGRLNRMKKAAARWWKNQQRTPQNTAGATNTKNTKNSGNNPKQNGPANPGNTTRRNTRRTRQGQQWTRAWWAKVRARAQQNTGKSGPSAPGGPGQGSGQTPGAPGAGPGAGPGNTGRTRRSPFQNAGQATAATNPAYTVERDDYPGAQAKTWQPDALTAGQPVLAATGPAALTPAPGRYPKRPGTTRPRSPIPMPPAPVPARTDPRLVKARNQAARAAQQTVGRTMDARHETEITLDDACDAADQLAEDAFKTHDQSRRLARKALDLRDTFELFAEDLATNHNLIGPLFTGACLRFAESMELLARMAAEMETSSLEATEKAETAGNEINDAYRPYNVAAADAGLSTPSAPIHNET